jgi:DNA-directed RNA polymerase subunit L
MSTTNTTTTTAEIVPKQLSAFIIPGSISTSNNGTLQFGIQIVNVSFVNAIRRTILSDIETVVFQTSTPDMNGCNILVNTTRMSNEVLKHRLSAIPIHGMNHLDEEKMDKLYVEVLLKNETTDVLYLTTEHFLIRSLDSSFPVDELPNRDDVFPINEISNQHIDVMLLRPKVEKHYEGDMIHFKCRLSKGKAKQESTYNVVSHCSYRFKLDDETIQQQLEQKRQEWQRKGLTKDEALHEETNWLSLDAKRIFLPNMFEFEIQTIGIFTNEEIMVMACKGLIDRLKDIMDSDDRFLLETSRSVTMTNAFDIHLKGEDYTIGKMIEYCFYNALYENAKQLHYIGFVKHHPHDSDSMLRVAYKRPISLSDVKTDFFKCVNDCILVLSELQKAFL